MPTIPYLTNCSFDFGAIGLLPKVLKALGAARPFVVTDPGLRANGLLDRLLAALGAPPAGMFADTPVNPTEAAAREAAQAYAAANADSVIGFGGGASMDMAKAVALFATHAAPYERYGGAQRGHRLIGKVPPVIAIPTTAGTGSEVSVGFVLILDSGRKETFFSPHLVPATAICDPELSLGLPPAITAATGMDAVTHCIEAVLSPIVNPPAEAIGLDGLEQAVKSGALERAFADGSDRDARWRMMMAAYEGALAFVKGLGAVHGLSHALGGLAELKLHHGTLNAVILPHALAMVGDAAPEKFARLRAAMGLAPNADLPQEISDLNARLKLPACLSALGVTESHWPRARDHAVSDLATATNAIPFDAEKYDALFRRAL